MITGFYDHNEGIAYPLQEHTPVIINGTPISEVVVGGSFSLSTASGYNGSQVLTLVDVQRIGYELLRLKVTVGSVLTFHFDVSHTAGADVARYTVVRAIGFDANGTAPEFGTGSLVINQLSGLLAIAVGSTEAIGVVFEEGLIHTIGDAPVASVRLANQSREINLTLFDDLIPAPVPTELLPSPLSISSNIPQVDICPTGYDTVETTTELVDVIVYEETIIQVDVPTFIEDAIAVATSLDDAGNFVVVGSITAWLASGAYDTEVYTITITDAGTNEFSAASNQGDLATVGNIVFDSFVSVGTKGLTVKWGSSVTSLTNGMTWEVTARRGTFNVPTNQSVFLPVTTQVAVPVLTPLSTALTLEYFDVNISQIPPVLTDIVVSDTYESEDDTARGLSDFNDVITEVAFITNNFQLQEGYNIDFGVVASASRLQFNLLPNGGRGLVPADAAVSDCNLALRTLFGAVPASGIVRFEAGAGLIVTPEKGAHRITLTFFEPTADGVQRCD